MKDYMLQKGLTTPVVIVIVAVVVVLGGFIYFANQPKGGESMMAENQAMMENKAMEDGDAMMGKKESIIVLNAQNNSGQQGKAMLQDMGGKTKVVIDIPSNSPAVAQPAHIHAGSCPNPGGIVYTLSAVTNGKSETVIDASMDTLKGKLPLAINVHKSAAEAKTYVSCGDLAFGEMMQKNEGAMMQEDAMMQKNEGAMMDKGQTMMKYSGTTLAGKSAPLLDFTKADYDHAVKSDKLVVLYFYANWCPICKAEFPIMQQVFNKLDTDKVIGFRVNYNDDQTDADEKSLAKQFGVAYQHTKVFVENGQRTLKSPESWDEKRYNTEINAALN